MNTEHWLAPLSRDERWPFHTLLWRWMPKHPWWMTAVFDRCWLVSFRLPPTSLIPHLPPGLTPDLHGGHAWMSLVVAEMSDMRPAWAPRWLGVGFDQLVVRAAVRRDGEPGVYFLHTDANHRLYAWAGDLLTFFHFHHRRLTIRGEGAAVSIDVGDSLSLTMEPTQSWPADSVFAAQEVAAPFLVERYHAFSMHPRTGVPGRVSVDRGGWEVRPVAARVRSIAAIHRLLPGAELDNALYAQHIPYTWTSWRPEPGLTVPGRPAR